MQHEGTEVDSNLLNHCSIAPSRADISSLEKIDPSKLGKLSENQLFIKLGWVLIVKAKYERYREGDEANLW